MPVEEQVAVIFAASGGYLDEVEPESVPDWERQFRDYMRDSHSEILDSMGEEKQLTEEIEGSLREAIEHFNENYEPEQQSLVDVSVGAEQEGGTEGAATGDEPRGEDLNAAGERS